MKVVTGLAQYCMYVQLDGDADKSTPHPLQTQVTLWVCKTASDIIIPIDKKSLNNFGDAELSPLCQIIRHSIQANLI